MNHVVYLNCDAASLAFVWVHSKLHADRTVAFVVGEGNAEQKVGLMWMWLTQIKARYKSVCVLRGVSTDAPPMGVLPDSPVLNPDRAIRFVTRAPEHVYFLRRVYEGELFSGSDFTSTTVYSEFRSPIKASAYIYSSADFIADLSDSDAEQMLRAICSADEISLKHVALLLGDEREYVVRAVFAQVSQ